MIRNSIPGLNYASLVDPFLRQLRAEVPVFAGMLTNQSVLDVCCGTGAQVYAYAACGLKAQGLDISPEMLSLARRRVKENFKFQPSFWVADAASMPFESGSFDYASITLALHDKDRNLQDRIISEMNRVLKRGGGLVIVDYSYPAPPNIFGFLTKLIEKLAGGDHSRNYASYMEDSGLECILRRHALMVEKEKVIKSDVLSMVLCRHA